MRNRTLCSVLFISLKTTMEKTRFDVRNVLDGRTHFVRVWRKILFASLVRDKHSILLLLYPLYLFFPLYFVTIPCAFFENYSPPQIRCTHFPNTCAPTFGRLSFHGNEIYTLFLFILYGTYVVTVSSLIKLFFFERGHPVVVYHQCILYRQYTIYRKPDA